MNIITDKNKITDRFMDIQAIQELKLLHMFAKICNIW